MARVAIVTGGASGIGRAASAVLVRRGGHVVLADIDAATVVAERISGQGPGTASAVRVDVRDAAGVAAVVIQTVQRRGRLDVMANNAGTKSAGMPRSVGGCALGRVIGQADEPRHMSASGCMGCSPLVVCGCAGRMVR